jgi:hypothetical protein
MTTAITRNAEAATASLCRGGRRGCVPVIFAAIWAMNVPSPIMIAAKIIMLRMTLHQPKKTQEKTQDETFEKYHHIRDKAAPNAARRASLFREKDERSVNLVRFPAA